MKPTTKPARKPNPADVARWVALLATPIPLYYGGGALAEARRERDNARRKLASWDLGTDGKPKSTA